MGGMSIVTIAGSRFRVQGSRFPRKKSIDSPFRRKYHMPLITPGIVQIYWWPITPASTIRGIRIRFRKF
jgi:hypothetical protein